MTDNFFNDPASGDTTPPVVPSNSDVTETPKIKIGEKEYSTDELQNMVGYASKVKEFEKTAGTDFDGLTKSWGKRGEEIGKLKKRVAEYEASQLKAKVTSGEQLTDEEMISQAKEQAKKLGLLTTDDFDKYYVARREAEKLLDDCRNLETEVDGKDGRPPFKLQEILTHMQETGIRNPEKAYKDKYEEQIDRWKEQQLRGAKPRGLFTDTTSTAGAKEPPNVKVTKDNLFNVISETIHGRE